jgi:hydrogenase nickel incorporation protein HypA/HybF
MVLYSGKNASMHELSIAQSILEIVEQYVPRDARAGVRSIRVRVGSLSGIVPESLEFSFSAIVSGTPLGSARLDIQRVPAICRCEGCGAEFETADFVFACPRCGGINIRLMSGSELRVVDIELEDVPVQES